VHAARVASVLLLLVLAPAAHAAGEAVALPEGYAEPLAVAPDGAGGFLVTVDRPPALLRFDAARRSYGEPVALPGRAGGDGGSGADPQDLGADLWGVVPDGAGGAFVASAKRGAVHHVDAEGRVTSIPLGPDATPLFLVADGAGGAWTADFVSGRVIRVNATSKVVEAPFPKEGQPAGADLGSDGRLYVAFAGPGELVALDGGSGAVASIVAGLAAPVTVGRSGANLWVAEHGANVVRHVGGLRVLTPWSPEGEVGTPIGLAPDGAGGVWTSLHTVGLFARAFPDGRLHAWPVPLGKAANAYSLATDGKVLVLALHDVARLAVVDLATLPPVPPTPNEPPVKAAPGAITRATLGLDGPAPANATLVVFPDAGSDLGTVLYEGGPVNPGARAAAFAANVGTSAKPGPHAFVACLVAEGAYGCRTLTLEVAAPGSPTRTPAFEAAAVLAAGLFALLARGGGLAGRKQR